MPHEVITLQFGNFANYVGAHYWNFQDELLGLQEQEEARGPTAQIDSEVLYRQGETQHGEGTYTPRLVMCDLSGAMGGVSAGGALYRDRNHDAGVVSTWAGRQEVHRSAPVAKSRFAEELEAEAVEGQEEEEEEAAGEEAGPSPLRAAAEALDTASGGGVRYFTDFLKAHLHPRSVHQLAGAWHGLTPFAGWDDGGAHWSSGGEEQREELLERIRFFAEESDQLQGFQCLVDDLTGFGQLAMHVLQEVRDEYGGGLPVMLYAVRPHAASPAADGNPAELRRWRLNEGLSLALLAPLCSTYTVVAPPAAHAALPLLRWQPGNLYHASAICAAALDTATLPYRLAATGGDPHSAIGRSDMWGLTQLLTGEHNSPLTALSLSMPCPGLPADMQQQAQRADARVQQGQREGPPAAAAGGGGGGGGSGSPSAAPPFTSHWLASLTPGIAATGDALRFAEAVVLRGPRSGGASVDLGAATAALDAALASERLRCVRHRTLAAQPLPLPLPFPHIFASGLSPAGDAPAGGSRLGAGSQDIASCAVLTRQAGTAAFGSAVAAAQRRFCSAAGSAQGQSTLDGWGYGSEELVDIQDQLTGLAHGYQED